MRIKDSIKWLWNASEGYRILILCRGMMGTLYVGISLFFIWICKCLIDIATKEPGDHMNVLIYLMAACLISRLLLSVAGVRLGNYIEIRFRNGLRHQLFNHLMESRWTGRERFHTGDILNRLEEDVDYMTDCRNSIAVNKLMDYPVIRSLWLYQPGSKKWIGEACMWFFPVGVPVYIAGLRAQRNLKGEMRKIADVSSTIIDLLHSEQDANAHQY